MLLRLASGAEQSDFLLVLATSTAPATDVVRLLVGEKVTVVGLVEAEERGEGVILGDLLGWDSGLRADITKEVVEGLEGKLGPVLLDCLTEVFALLPEQEAARLVARARRVTGGRRLVAVLHTDCLPADLVAAVAHSATTTVSAERRPAATLVTVRHRKPGGRLVTSKELLTSVEGRVRVVPYSQEKEQVVVEEDAEATIGQLTTFSLSTSKEAEQEAREALVLPFYKEEQRGEVKIQGAQGAIYYQPDSGDDWDDEDPDEDLDF